MFVSRVRLLLIAAALGLAGGLTAVSPAAAAGPPAPGTEGPAGPPALMPNGRVATPPPVNAPQVSTCPAAPYGTNSAAPGTGKTVALTFDDGPGVSASAIMSELQTNGVRATFFNLGENMAARPQQVRDEAAAGYVLGNHTWDHPNMTTLSASAQATEIDEATTEQLNLTGIYPCLFRPPGGNYNSTTLSLAQQRGMTVWLWSVTVYTRTASTGWTATGWHCVSPPVAAQSASGTSTTFACIGTDRYLWYDPYTTSHGWSTASSLGPPPAEAFSAGALGVDANAQRFDVTGAATSGVYTRTPGTAWSSLGGATTGGVALSSF